MTTSPAIPVIDPASRAPAPQARTPDVRCSLFIVRWAPAPAFTLLEVLIGILILALALLGLGAVIPVVVRTQKLATDATSCVTAANDMAAYLKSRTDLDRLTQGTLRAGWGVWLLDQNWSPATTGAAQDRFLWEPLAATELDPATGEFSLAESPGDPPTIIAVGDRLWPSRRADGADPIYVWDVIGRRVLVASGQPMKLQLAIFLRRIDMNVAIPITSNPNDYQFTLYDVLTGTLPLNHVPAAPATFPVAARRLPVAIDANTGMPTHNGVITPNGAYSAPRVATVKFADPPRKADRLILDGTNPPGTFELISLPGQKLVDNLGNVYTVLGLDERNPGVLIIDPPAPVWVNDRYDTLGRPHPLGMNTAQTFRQVAFTPQVPGSVAIITLTPQDPK